ncbi:hypothetical protein J2TS4_54140 [Paenibacillus sp. J2TS4]|nr:hypothetical protein J2TS4_54140 [Paenibacillus sp. J2TS4]
MRWGGTAIIGLLAVLGVWGYSLSPGVHFKPSNHPVLAVPKSSGYMGSWGMDFIRSQAVKITSLGVDFQGADLLGGDRKWPSSSDLEGADSLSSASSTRPSDGGRTGEAMNDPAFNILILGVDARAEESSRTDVIMLAHVDPGEKEVNILSIPRDTQIYLEGTGYTKINHVHFIGSKRNGNSGGTKASIQAVSDLLNVTINYYVKIDFSGFESIIDAIGGVELDLPSEVWLTQPLTPREPLLLPAGLQTLNGELALDYVRERYSREDGEFGRQEAQMEVIRSIAAKLTKLDYIPKLPGLIHQVKEEVLDTNFSDSDLLSLAWLFKNLQQDQLRYMQMPGHSNRAIDAIMGLQLYYWVPDKDQLYSISENYFH